MNPSSNNAIIWHLYCDGACRGNPGPASIGIALYDSSETPFFQHGSTIGETTNNEAEYRAVIRGLELALELFAKQGLPPHLKIHMDSELVVKQIKKIYKVKHEKMKLFHTNVMTLLENFESWEIIHVRREFNKEADRLANEALDSAG